MNDSACYLYAGLKLLKSQVELLRDSIKYQAQFSLLVVKDQVRPFYIPLSDEPLFPCIGVKN